MTKIVDLTRRLRRKSKDKLLRKAIEKIRSMPPEMEDYLEASWQLIIADLVQSVNGEADTTSPMSDEIISICAKAHEGCYFSEEVDGNETPFILGETEVCIICARKVENIIGAIAKGGRRHETRGSEKHLH